jgi:hypothetical protein
MLQMITKLQEQVVHTCNLIAELSSDEPENSSTVDTSSVQPPFGEQPSAGRKKGRKNAEPVKPMEKPVVVEEDNTPVTTEELEFLSRTVPGVPHEGLQRVIKIIRESSSIGADEEDIEVRFFSWFSPKYHSIHPSIRLR